MRAFVTGLGLALALTHAPLGSQGTSPSHPLPTAPTSSLPELRGATNLFDGSTLQGWTRKGGRYDGAARWSVEDSCIVGQVGPKGQGGLLYTQRPYANFVFACEVKIDYPFDSGIFLGMEPRKRGRRGWQVTLDHRPGGEIGGIYSDGWLAHNPKGERAFRRGRWNQVIVRSRGFPPRIEAWIGETKITDYQEKKEEGFAPIGRIGIQVHGARKSWWKNKVRFRNLRILELPSHDPRLFLLREGGRLELRPQAEKQGWTAMLASLTPWTLEGDDPSPFRLKEGILSLLAQGPGKNLWTRRKYRDFELRLDFQLSPSANSGLLLLGTPGGSGHFSYAHEIQILDDWTWEKDHEAKLKPWQRCGSLYGYSPPRLAALLPPGAWNSYEIQLRKGRLRVRLNGRKIQDLDLRSLKGSPYAKGRTEGSLGLQVHGGSRTRKGPYVWIRNFFLRRIE